MSSFPQIRHNCTQSALNCLGGALPKTVSAGRGHQVMTQSSLRCREDREARGRRRGLEHAEQRVSSFDASALAAGWFSRVKHPQTRVDRTLVENWLLLPLTTTLHPMPQKLFLFFFFSHRAWCQVMLSSVHAQENCTSSFYTLLGPRNPGVRRCLSRRLKVTNECSCCGC